MYFFACNVVSGGSSCLNRQKMQRTESPHLNVADDEMKKKKKTLTKYCFYIPFVFQVCLKQFETGIMEWRIILRTSGEPDRTIRNFRVTKMVNGAILYIVKASIDISWLWHCEMFSREGRWAANERSVRCVFEMLIYHFSNNSRDESISRRY